MDQGGGLLRPSPVYETRVTSTTPRNARDPHDVSLVLSSVLRVHLSISHSHLSPYSAHLNVRHHPFHFFLYCSALLF